MEKYRPVDALYEDIYDFDDINNKSFDFDLPRPKGTYIIDENEAIQRPFHRPRVNDDQIHLPTIIGRNLAAKPTARKSVTDIRLEKARAELNNKNIDWHKERAKLPAPRQPQKEYTDSDRHRPTRLDPVSICSPTPKYDKTLPHQLETYLANPVSQRKHGDSYCEFKGQPTSEIFMRKIREYEESIKPKKLRQKLHEESTFYPVPPNTTIPDRSFVQKDPIHTTSCPIVSDLESVNDRQKAINTSISIPVPPKTAKPDDVYQLQNLSVTAKYQPNPPACPKPEANKTYSYSKHHRRLKYPSRELDTDVSVHNPPALQFQPAPPKEVTIDYEADMQEALRVERELALLHKELEERKRAEWLPGSTVTHPDLPLETNPNATRFPCLDRKPVSAASPAMVQKSWNHETAIKGIGFKSKIRNEVEKPRKIMGTPELPDKIKKDLKKYFN